MQQLEIQYFFPLTEQIELDLDFTASEAYDQEKRKQYYQDIFANSMPLWATSSPISIPPENDLLAYINEIYN